MCPPGVPQQCGVWGSVCGWAGEQPASCSLRGQFVASNTSPRSTRSPLPLQLGSGHVKVCPRTLFPLHASGASRSLSVPVRVTLISLRLCRLLASCNMGDWVPFSVSQRWHVDGGCCGQRRQESRPCSTRPAPNRSGQHGAHCVCALGSLKPYSPPPVFFSGGGGSRGPREEQWCQSAAGCGHRCVCPAP